MINDMYLSFANVKNIKKELNFAGCSKKDIKITYNPSNSVLLVETNDDFENYIGYKMLVSNRLYDTTKINAKLKHGLLTLEIPLNEENKPREIQLS